MKALKIILMVLGVFFTLGILLSLVLVSLSGAREKARVYGPEFPYTEAPAPLISPSALVGEKAPGEVEEISPEAPSRLVIKTGTLNIVVKDIESSVRKIIQYAEGKGGWVVSSSVTEREKIPTGSITVRVPVENFDEAIAYFRELAEKVSYEGTKGQDVTEEYVDLQAQLRNLEVTETQLLKIMERSGTISEVLSVQRELTNIREKIERTKGRIQYLERSAAMATITVNLALSEELLPIPPAEKWRPVYVFKRAWRSTLTTLRGISYLLIWILTFAIIWVPVAVIIWQVCKFWKKKKAKIA